MKSFDRSIVLGLEMPGPVSEPLARVTHRLEARTGELVERISEMIRGIPEYAAIRDPVVWEEVRKHAEQSVGRFYTVLRDGTPPLTQTGQYFARRRAEQGVVSFPSLRSAYVGGVRILWGALLCEVERDPELREELLERSSWAMAHINSVTGALADAYYEAQKSTRHRDQLVRDLFDEIIDGDPASIASLETRARLAGLDCDSAHRAVLFRWSSGVPGDSPFEGLPPVPAVAACAEGAGVTPDIVLAARRGNELLVVTPWREAQADPERLRARLDDALASLSRHVDVVQVGVSGRVASVGELRNAYRECARATELGARLDPHGPVHFYESYVLDDLLDSAPAQAERLIAQTIGPLLANGEGGERLIETLDRYFRSGRNLKATAAVLDIHRNTLSYRLQQIAKLTELDLDDPAEHQRFEAALRCLRLRAPAGIHA